MRDTESRPLSWRISISTQVNNAIKKLGAKKGNPGFGFLADTLFTRMMATRDNLGRMPADKYTLKGVLFQLVDFVTPEDIQEARDILADEGLIILYNANGSEYLILPKVSKHSRLIGNMSDSSQCPEPSEDVIKAWEQRFNDVYTPCERRSRTVQTEYERRIGIVLPEGEGEGEGEGEVEGEVEGEEEVEGERKRKQKLPPTDSIVLKKLTEVQTFVDGFEKTYFALSGHKYKHSKKDFITATSLIKEFGISEVIKKAKILAVMCQRGKPWFAKDGLPDYTIGNLSAHWNKILPQARLTPEEIKHQEFLQKLKEETERNARLDDQIKSGTKK